ncbi:hypothetical protein HYPGJ_20271 [Hyphomicrobium sp. GJ21]|nr:hypothetical protein HYPGJ_20271 [Hyphomicrobium sp. GJ21]
MRRGHWVKTRRRSRVLKRDALLEAGAHYVVATEEKFAPFHHVAAAGKQPPR